MKDNALLAEAEALRKRKKDKMRIVVLATITVLAVLLVSLSVILILDLLGRNVEYTLEAGEPLPSAQTICGKSGARFEDGVEEGDYSKPGVYEFYILRGKQKIRVRLTVEDTKPPVAELLALKAHHEGPFPEAIDFFANVTDASAVEAKFLNAVNLQMGSHEVQVELSDIYGNGKKYKTTLEIVEDTEAPRFTVLPRSVCVALGDAIAYRKFVEVTDNCFGDVELIIDSTAVKSDVLGSYPVKYIAVDAAGNRSEQVSLNLIVVKELVEWDALRTKLEAVAASFTYKGVKMKDITDKKLLCCAIYSYVNSPQALSGSDARIRFDDSFSYTEHGDWMKEAYDALNDPTPQGDCYTYFAVAKAFFEYFGIDNLDIERTKEIRDDGTHYWSAVNVGTETAPEWYYFDATRLRIAHDSGNACLFTEAQRVSYNAKNKNFLHCDTSRLPMKDFSTVVINTGFTW